MALTHYIMTTGLVDTIRKAGITGTIHSTHDTDRIRLTVTTDQVGAVDNIVSDVIDDTTVPTPFMFRIPTTGSSYATHTTRTTWAFGTADRFMTIGLTAPIGPDGTIGPCYRLPVIAAI